MEDSQSVTERSNGLVRRAIEQSEWFRTRRWGGIESCQKGRSCWILAYRVDRVQRDNSFPLSLLVRVEAQSLADCASHVVYPFSYLSGIVRRARDAACVRVSGLGHWVPAILLIPQEFFDCDGIRNICLAGLAVSLRIQRAHLRSAHAYLAAGEDTMEV